MPGWARGGSQKRCDLGPTEAAGGQPGLAADDNVGNLEGLGPIPKSAAEWSSVLSSHGVNDVLLDEMDYTKRRRCRPLWVSGLSRILVALFCRVSTEKDY
jgi:hypothetical protein